MVRDEPVDDDARAQVEAALQHLQRLHGAVGGEGEVGGGHAPAPGQARGVGVLVLHAVAPGERVADGEERDLGRSALAPPAHPGAAVAGEDVIGQAGAWMAPQAGRVGHGHEADLRVGLDREVAFEDEVEIAERARARAGVAGEEEDADGQREGRGQEGEQEPAARRPRAQARRRRSRWMSPVTSAASSPTYMSISLRTPNSGR